MEVYESFARVYDELMDEVPYEEWADFIRQKLGEYAIREGLMLELGCGTGKMMELMGDAGFDMIGVDSSMEMLQIAQEKSQEGNKDFLYLWQDMREFELYGTVRAVISICDSINYITNPEELTQVFRLVNNYLDPGGIFLFDFNTDYKTKLQEILQKNGTVKIEYRLLKEEGPEHDKTFNVEVLFNGKRIGEGIGKSKKSAEQAAASAAIKRI